MTVEFSNWNSGGKNNFFNKQKKRKSSNRSTSVMNIIFFIWYSLKQFRSGVKERWTWHFEQNYRDFCLHLSILHLLAFFAWINIGEWSKPSERNFLSTANLNFSFFLREFVWSSDSSLTSYVEALDACVVVIALVECEGEGGCEYEDQSKLTLTLIHTLKKPNRRNNDSWSFILYNHWIYKTKYISQWFFSCLFLVHRWIMRMEKR